MRKRTLFERLFMSPNFFTIAIRRHCDCEVPMWERLNYDSQHTISVTRRYWVADPFLVDDGDDTYMFYEAVCDGKGRIEVVRLNDDCTVSEPYIALERDYHLSYPFVFRYNCEWYMIPESCAADNVQLFKAKSFPFEWEYVAAILEKHAVDTTVAEIDGKLLMLTFLPQAGTENVYPEAYWLTLNKDGTHDIQKLNWMEYDTLVVRGAGKMIKWDNSVVIRPVQINRENSYGDGVAFCRVVIGGNAYSEKRISALLPENVRIKKYRADGLHTYAVSRKFEVIDVRCQLSDPFKIWRKLRGRK